uniref:AlNc14C449G11718 protein n=1 Tax=Albugo laibachii Nc14 TaxID=890382 RepID=F0WZX6_9STRA|nr:AlNc14C449G11718 [Albugo laibachii Nc14]|eukprot:CCA27056.1 AlNc14C449G11718 [Albugo laibachii Nc14]
MTSAALTLSTWPTRHSRNELKKSQRGREPVTHTPYEINPSSWMLNRTRWPPGNKRPDSYYKVSIICGILSHGASQCLG